MSNGACEKERSWTTKRGLKFYEVEAKIFIKSTVCGNTRNVTGNGTGISMPLETYTSLATQDGPIIVHHAEFYCARSLVHDSQPASLIQSLRLRKSVHLFMDIHLLLLVLNARNLPLFSAVSGVKWHRLKVGLMTWLCV